MVTTNDNTLVYDCNLLTEELKYSHQKQNKINRWGDGCVVNAFVRGY